MHVSLQPGFLSHPQHRYSLSDLNWLNSLHPQQMANPANAKTNDVAITGFLYAHALNKQ